MLIRPLREEEQDQYNRVVQHPLQSWEWGEFRKKTGLRLERIGFFDQGRLINAYQVTFHQIPVIGKTAGYMPKGFMPDEEQLASLKQIAQEHNALFVKLEPNVMQQVETPSAHSDIARFLLHNGARPGRPLFTRYTFIIDLTKSEDDLFENLQSKTRYNVNLAYKKGVSIVEDSSENGLNHYLYILQETTKRQKFYAHSADYFQKMWQTLQSSGMIRIFHAVYEGTVLTSWIMFVFNNTLYYPYGASLRIHRDVMANNLMMWEMIRFGKQVGCTQFDLWGALGPHASNAHPWAGFHRFKKGYGGDLYESIGTYDVVQDPLIYPVFRVAESMRWQVLRLKALLPLL